jgi:hypothetical protein
VVAIEAGRCVRGRRAALKREIKALTLNPCANPVGMQTGLTDAVTPFLANNGWQGSPSSFDT